MTHFFACCNCAASPGRSSARTYPTQWVVTLDLFHDAQEVVIGDIPTLIKHHNAELLDRLPEVEALARERLLGMVPAALQTAYCPLLHGSGRDPELLPASKAADKLDAYLNCAMELAVGSRKFVVVKRHLGETHTGWACPRWTTPGALRHQLREDPRRDRRLRSGVPVPRSRWLLLASKPALARATP